MEKQKRFTVADLYLAVFLQINGLPFEFETSRGRVIFSFPATDELYKLVNAYNNGAAAPVLDFVTALKDIRAQMHNIKASVR